MKTPFYDRDGITIYCGDCLEVMPGLEPWFDALISDWPYGTTQNKWDSVIPLEPLWKQCKRLVKKRGAVVTTASQPFTSILVMSNRKWFKYEWIWKKNLKVNHLNARKRPMLGHETVMVFADGDGIYNPQRRKRTTEVKHGNKINVKSAVYGRIQGPILDRQSDWLMPDTVLEFNAVHGSRRLHPTQKPVPLMAYLIRTYTNPGDLLLDNAMGSGSTLIAAQREGRRAVGIELSEEYCQIAVERLASPTFFSLPQTNDHAPKPKQLTLLDGEE